MLIEEKVELFRQYIEEQKEKNNQSKPIIDGKTMYKGFPIGRYAIQIRNNIKKNNVIYTPKIIKELSSLGILKRQKDSTVDEKVDFLVEFARLNPKIMQFMYKTKGINKKMLCFFLEVSEEEKKSIDKFNSYYEYVYSRIRKYKLSEGNYEKLKNARIYTDSRGRNNENDKFINENINVVNLYNELLDKYGSHEEIISNYVEEVDKNFNIIKKSRALLLGIDISSPNLQIQKKGYLDLINDIREHKAEDVFPIPIIDSKAIDRALELLPDRYANLIKMKYGLGERKYSTDEIPKAIGCSTFYYNDLKNKAINKFKELVNKNEFMVDPMEEMGDCYEFVNDIVKVLGIVKREEPLSNEERIYVRECYKKAVGRKIEICNKFKLLEYADDEIVNQLLRTEFGNKVEDDPSRLHFLYGRENKGNGSIFVDNFIRDPKYSVDYKQPNNKSFSYAVYKKAMLNKENEPIIRELLRRQNIAERFRSIPVTHIGLSKLYASELEATSLYDIIHGKENDLQLKVLKQENIRLMLIRQITDLLEKKGLHYEMTFDEMEDYLNLQKKQEISIYKKIISDKSRALFSLVGISSIDKFKNSSYDEIIGIGREIVREVDRKVEEKQLQIENFPIKREPSVKPGNLLVEDMGLTMRAYNCLKRARLNTLQDVVSCSKKDIRDIKNLGEVSYNEIVEKVESYGLRFEEKELDKQLREQEELKSVDIKYLYLSDEVYEILKLHNINTVGEYLSKRNSIASAGITACKELIDKCKLEGIELSENIEYQIYESAVKNAQSLTIDDLDLTERLYNSLKKAGIVTVEQIINRANFNFRGMGFKTQEELEEKIHEFGLKFKYELGPYECVGESDVKEEASQDEKSEQKDLEVTQREDNVTMDLDDEANVNKDLTDLMCKLKEAYKKVNAKEQEVKSIISELKSDLVDKKSKEVISRGKILKIEGIIKVFEDTYCNKELLELYQRQLSAQFDLLENIKAGKANIQETIKSMETKLEDLTDTSKKIKEKADDMGIELE